MTTLAKSHTNTRKEIAIETKASICQILRMDEEAFGMMQYHAGLLYLDCYLHEEDKVIDKLSRSRIFWNWFKNEWTARDEVFLNQRIGLLKIGSRMTLYKELHDARTLACEIYPPSYILKSVFSEISKTTLQTC